MRLLTIVLILCGSALASEQPANRTYPLWDGQESVADYAEHVNLPPAKTLDLGNNIKLELVLIPAGQFVMGTPEPKPIDEDGFQKKIAFGQALLSASGVMLLVMLVVVVIRAIRKRCRPQLSLRLLLLTTVAAGGCVLSGLHWQHSARRLEKAKADYEAAIWRFQSAYDDEKPAHSVTLKKPFYMGKYDVTQEQYQQTMGTNPSFFKGKDNPVERVSWNDAQAYCKKLSEQTNETARLPSNAEWEFACRAGTTTAYYSGDGYTDLARVGWFDANSKNNPHPVGQKEPNAFGLYDMHGNVWQLCEDWYGEDYYGKSGAENPQGRPPQGVSHLMRGGSWEDNPTYSRSAFRMRQQKPNECDESEGFRVVVKAAR